MKCFIKIFWYKKEKVYIGWVEYFLINFFFKGRMGNYFCIVLDKCEFLIWIDSLVYKV